jgi:hypothetical protein
MGFTMNEKQSLTGEYAPQYIPEKRSREILPKNGWKI